MVSVPTFSGVDFNFTYWQQHLIEFSIRGYVDVVGFFFWSILFTGVIAYIYVKNQSAVAAAVAILIIFAAFTGTGIFLEVPFFVMFFQAIVAVSLAGLVVVFLMRRRQ